VFVSGKEKGCEIQGHHQKYMSSREAREYRALSNTPDTWLSLIHIVCRWHPLLPLGWSGRG